jgi:hypothetical protein
VTFATELVCDVDVSLEQGADGHARLFGARLAPEKQSSFEYWYAEWGVKTGRHLVWAYFKSTKYGYNDGYPLIDWTTGSTWTHVHYVLSRDVNNPRLRVELTGIQPLLGPAAGTDEPLTFQLALGVIENDGADFALLFDNLRCLPR